MLGLDQRDQGGAEAIMKLSALPAQRRAVTGLAAIVPDDLAVTIAHGIARQLRPALAVFHEDADAVDLKPARQPDPRTADQCAGAARLPAQQRHPWSIAHLHLPRKSGRRAGAASPAVRTQCFAQKRAAS